MFDPSALNAAALRRDYAGETDTLGKREREWCDVGRVHKNKNDAVQTKPIPLWSSDVHGVRVTLVSVVFVHTDLRLRGTLVSYKTRSFNLIQEG